MKNASELKGYNGIFATRLRDLMWGDNKRPKTTQETLAKVLGVTRQTISQYMDGSIVPNIDKLYLIAKYFNISSDYLVFGLETKKSDNHEINRRLGLSDEAIEAIENIKKYKNGELRIDVLNNLFSGLWIDKFIILLIQHAEALHYKIKCMPKKEPEDKEYKNQCIRELDFLEWEFGKYAYSFIKKWVLDNYEKLKSNENFMNFTKDNLDYLDYLNKIFTSKKSKQKNECGDTK